MAPSLLNAKNIYYFQIVAYFNCNFVCTTSAAQTDLFSTAYFSKGHSDANARQGLTDFFAMGRMPG